jgi:hypothetical protein
MWAADPVVCMRAADKLKKVAAKRASLLQPFIPEPLRLADERRPLKCVGTWRCCFRVRSSIADCVSRVFARLRGHLRGRSSIVKTTAPQGSPALAGGDRAVVQEGEGYLEHTLHAGTLAMKARARKLLSPRRVRFVCDSRVT